MSLLDEDLIELSDVPAMLPKASRKGGRHRCTVGRWVRQGVRGVKLETVPIGGRDVTSKQAVRRFLDRVAAARGRAPAALAAAEENALDCTNAELAAAGW